MLEFRENIDLIAGTPIGFDKTFGGFAGTGTASRDGAERRSADRFPIEREVRYRVLGKRGTYDEGVGTTVNISSNGVLFTTDQILVPGKRIEVAISWPAQLDNRCQLKLVARGRISRLEHGRAAVEIQQYEFRTAGRSAA